MPSSLIARARAMRKAMTPPERELWLQLRSLKSEGWRFRRQSPEGPYILDFVCRRSKLVIEVDGAHHSSAEQARHDQIRDAWLGEHGFRILRFWATDVENEREGVLHSIRAALGATETVGPPQTVPQIPAGIRRRRLVRLGLRRRD